MSYVIVGLGNPGEEYAQTRHNTGRIVLDYFRKKYDFSEWEENKKLRALASEGKIGKTKTILLEPETFMNKSGLSVKPLITSKKKAEKLAVIYDDLDLPLGTFKISFNKGTGGHKGLESVAKNIKTKEFIRVRVGISQATPKGKLKKPRGEQKILDYLMADFSKKDLEFLKKIKPKIAQALKVIILEGRQRAMNMFNR
ncbi:MAG: aminoacyl-tRNA hydrolase [Candidatus Pacebacteria bacterium]|nr:aminoacyl-tRNA hydrolase [Candidatus Paceibacterota bacterium]